VKTVPVLKDGERLLTINELAEKLQVSRQTLYRWSYSGEGPTVLRIGRHVRYAPADVDAWLARQRKRAS
jgi:excisionase family DNA binding protein